VEASGVLDFDAKARRAIVLNGSSDLSGLACTSRLRGTAVDG
jgi:hypothetical protein